MKKENPNKTFKEKNNVKITASSGFYYIEPSQEEIGSAMKDMKKRVDNNIIKVLNRGSVEAAKRGIHPAHEYEEDEGTLEWVEWNGDGDEG